MLVQFNHSLTSAIWNNHLYDPDPVAQKFFSTKSTYKVLAFVEPDFWKLNVKSEQYSNIQKSICFICKQTVVEEPKVSDTNSVPLFQLTFENLFDI